MMRLAAVMLVCAALAGCQMDPDAEQAEIISNLTEAGFPSNDIQIYDGEVYVGRDSRVTLQASREMLVSIGDKEQYRTTNLVSLAVKRICVNPTDRFNRYARLSAGLDLAIENYNALALNFVMVRGPATGCDANIIAQTAGGTGGSAGFPSNGMPYSEINIGTGLDRYSVDVNEHVISHELGHCIGFRHSDYYNRSISCGSGGDEGQSTVGAIHIEGTPTTATRGGSVMNSCFRSTETGEWSSSDITALNVLY